MLYGIGTDIVQISRIRDAIGRHGEAFLQRCFTAEEIARAQGKHDPVAAFARLFAAKEALLKALGSGMREGLSWQDLRVSWDHAGAPSAHFGQGAARYLPQDRDVTTRLSMSDDGAYAVAFATIEYAQEQGGKPSIHE